MPKKAKAKQFQRPKRRPQIKQTSIKAADLIQEHSYSLESQSAYSSGAIQDFHYSSNDHKSVSSDLSDSEHDVALDSSKLTNSLQQLLGCFEVVYDQDEHELSFHTKSLEEQINIDHEEIVVAGTVQDEQESSIPIEKVEKMNIDHDETDVPDTNHDEGFFIPKISAEELVYIDQGDIAVPETNQDEHKFPVSTRSVEVQTDGDHDDFFLPDINQNYSAILEKAVQILPDELPPSWSIFKSQAGLHLLMHSTSPATLTQRSIVIGNDGSLDFFAHGQLLPKTHAVHCQLEKLDFDSAENFSISLLKILSRFRLFEACHGAPNEKFKSLWKNMENCYVDRNCFHETRYSITLRSENCDVLISQRQRQCRQCRQVSHNVSRRKMATVDASDPTPKVFTPPKNKQFQFMSTPEKRAKNRRIARTISSLRRRNKLMVGSAMLQYLQPNKLKTDYRQHRF